MATKIDLDQLAREIRVLDRRDPLYRVLKDELGAIGHWRVRPRGDPAKGYRMKGSKAMAGG